MPYLFKNIQVDDIMKYITVKQLYEKLNAQHPGIKSRTVTNLINPILDMNDPIEDNYILDVCSSEKGCE